MYRLSKMLSLLNENKMASAGAAAMVTGVILLLSASTIDSEPDGVVSEEKAKKKKTLLALGGSLMSLGVLAGVYDQYTRRSKSAGGSSSQMSPAELSRFQDRVSAAAAKLRKSLHQKSSSPSPMSSESSSSYGSSDTESAAELAARASAQISSFIQQYS